jgi:hypothetical protein
MADQNDYPTPQTRVTGVGRTKVRNSGVTGLPSQAPTQTPTKYPNPGANPPSGIKAIYPNPNTVLQQPNTVLQQPNTVVQQPTRIKKSPKTNGVKVPKFTLPKFDLNFKQLLPLIGASVAIAAMVPLLLNIFPQPRIAFQKTFKLPSQECKDDQGKFLQGRVLILGQEGKTNTLTFCNDSIVNGVENGVKRGLSDDKKSFALPAGNYVINAASKFKAQGDENKSVTLPFLYEFAAQESGKAEIKNNLAKLPDDWAKTHKVGSVGVIYPINYQSTDEIKSNEIALELAVKPDSAIYQLHKMKYLDGTTLVVKGNLKP